MYKGELKGFPTEVVEKMLERQVETGNKRDVTVFEQCNYAGFDDGGFDWDETMEGSLFWDEITSRDFDIFFERYPKTETLQQELERLELRIKEIKKQLQ